MQTMYPAVVNSPTTELASAINASQTTIPVLNASVLPAAPNLATIGIGELAETILYTGKSGNNLTGVTRGFQGVASSWNAGQKVARYFTAYDHDAFRQNIEDHETLVLTTQADLNTHTAATTGVHGATSAATPNTIVQRDPNGRFKAGAPAAADDVARKAEVDAHASRTDNPHNVTKSQVGLGNVDNVKQATKTEFDAHVAETVNWQRFKLTGDNGRSKVPPYYGDVNNLKDTGMYGIAEGAGNAPVPTMGVLLVYNQDGQHIRQVWYAFWGGDPYENRVYTRSSFNGGDTWTSWVELITSRGGGMTGDLFIQSKWPAVWLIDTDINNRINILHDNNAFYVQLRDASGNWIRDLLMLTNDGATAQLGTNNIWHTGMLRINNGTLEYNDGSGWKSVGFDPTSMTVNTINGYVGSIYLAGSQSVDIFSLSGAGVLGQLELAVLGDQGHFVGISLIVDGVEKPLYSQDGSRATTIAKTAYTNVNNINTSATPMAIELFTPIKYSSSLVVRAKNLSTALISTGWGFKGVYYT